MKWEKEENTGALKVTTAEGEFVVFEDEDRQLSIMATRATDARKHYTSILVKPYACNTLRIRLEPR